MARASELLAVLTKLPCVVNVNPKPVGAANKPNHFGVSYQLRLPDSKPVPKRSAVTGPDGARPTLAAAFQAAIDFVRGELAQHGVEAEVDLEAGLPLPAQPEATAEELEWLAEWLDRQEDPAAVTTDQADAALEQHRQGQAGASTILRLQQAQLDRARLRAAERQLERAQRAVERARDALPEEQVAKRQQASKSGVPDHPRVANGDPRGNPHGWDHYYGYSKERYQKEEVEEQDRCSVPIDRERRDVAPPGGLGDGSRGGEESRTWMEHWRRGPARKLRGWAAGSLGVIIYMLAALVRYFDVVDEVGAELGFMSRAESRRAETCIYACERASAVVKRVKWCKTEEQRQDYHVIMTAFAPRRSEECLLVFLLLTRGNLKTCPFWN